MTALSPVPVCDSPVVHPGPGLLRHLGEPVDLVTHRKMHGTLTVPDLDTLIALTSAVHLRGRGGAGFPFATKLSAAAASGRRPIVVVNAAEGEPASAKDAALALHAPHLVLDGAAAAAAALGSRTVHVVLPGDRPRARASMLTAVGERAAAGGRVRWRTTTASPRFVAGQARAVVELLSGRSNLPVTSWRPEAMSGVDGRPTLLSNAETWAQVGRLVQHGLHSYLSLGTSDEPGTTLLTVTGPGDRAEVHEAAFGSPLSSYLRPESHGAAVLIGGFHGAWAPWSVVAASAVSAEALTRHGVPIGAGVVHALGADMCLLDLTASIVEYLAGQTARRCGPCFNGLPALADAVRGLVDARPGSRERAVALVGLVEGRGACAHPDGTVRMVRSLMSTFDHEVEAHARGGCSSSGHLLQARR